MSGAWAASENELRAKLIAAGLEQWAETLLAVTASSIRLRPNESGEPQASAYRETLVPVPGLSGGVVAIATSGYHHLAMMADGSVRAWGANEHGQLGDGTRRDRRSPVPIRGLDRVVAIAAGMTHSLALGADGSVVAWGDNDYGQLCDGTRDQRRTPVSVRDLDGGVKAIVAGANNSLALRADGSVVGWGLSVADKLGIDSIPERPILIPNLVSGIAAIAAAGGHHHLALTESGCVFAWGTTAGRLTPGPVSGLTAGVIAIATAGSHSLALRSDGSVDAWGDNTNGQLGDGTTTKSLLPVSVRGLQAIAAIAAGPSCSFAVTADGVALSWGWNYEGQLGDGSTTDRHMPVRIAGGGAGVTAIAPRLVLRADGSVVSWGGESPTDEETGRDSDSPVGSTKLGGSPDLPPGTPWPSFEGRPMAFVTQINLAEVGPLDELGLLPQAGILSFFCAPADLGQSGSWHVSFTDKDSALSRVEPPAELSRHDFYRALSVRGEPELTCPSWESSILERLGLSQEERFAYRDALESEDDSPRHRMLGHPDTIHRDLREAEPELCLLLQVDSDEAAGMEWGDVGRLYFWIRADDLEGRLFARSRLDFQCY